MNIYEKLAAIQQEIKVPKDLNNDFAGFKYRSAEGILEKLKPLLDRHKVTIWLTDEVEDHSEQSYIRAWVHIVNLEDTGEVLAVSALAREEKTRPKMSEGQLTGAASSYARKYALNGLLLLDDNKDPDSQDNTPKKMQQGTKDYPQQPLTGAATDKQRETIARHLKSIGVSEEDQKDYLMEQYAPEFPLTKQVASEIIDSMFAN